MLRESRDEIPAGEMLSEVAESFTESYTGAQPPDHYGAEKASGDPDSAASLPPSAQSR